MHTFFSFIAACAGSCLLATSALSAPSKPYKKSHKKAQIASVSHTTPYTAGFADIVAPLLPAVVNVAVIKNVNTYSLDIGPQQMGRRRNDMFRDFLEQFEMTPEKRRVPMGAGSGFIIDAKGYVVTNAHVVEGADEVRVTLADKREFKAKVIGKDIRTDLALLKIDASKKLPFVRFGNAGHVRVGDWAIAIGNALGGLGGTVTVGVISQVGRSFSMQPSHVGSFFQTDAQINLGNSGGPLFNTKGQVIGVNMMMAASPIGGNTGIGFAIPSDVAQYVIEQLRQHGHVKRGWLGIHIQDITPDIASSLALDAPTGALVGHVVKDGPADKAGVKRGDLILKVNGNRIKNAAQTNKFVGRTSVGDKVMLHIWRADSKTGVYKTHNIPVTIGTSESLKGKLIKPEDIKKNLTSKAVNFYGLTLQTPDDKVRRALDLPDNTKGLLITHVDTTSKASEFFKAGDVLLSIDNREVRTIADAQKIAKNAEKANKSALLCYIQRNQMGFFVAINLHDTQDNKKP